MTLTFHFFKSGASCTFDLKGGATVADLLGLFAQYGPAEQIEVFDADSIIVGEYEYQPDNE